VSAAAGGGGGEGAAAAAAAGGGAKPRLTLTLGQKALWWTAALGRAFVGGARARATWEALQEAKRAEAEREGGSGKKKTRR